MSWIEGDIKITIMSAIHFGMPFRSITFELAVVLCLS